MVAAIILIVVIALGIGYGIYLLNKPSKSTGSVNMYPRDKSNENNTKIEK